jgi:hypothetical protein
MNDSWKIHEVIAAFVAAKEIRLYAARSKSRRFNPAWLYERILQLPDPPDERERRFQARAMIKAGHAILRHSRPELAAEVFEKAVALMQDSGSGLLRAKAMAGVVLAWECMGHPRSGSEFVARANRRFEEKHGRRSALRQQKQFERIVRAAPN